jgi:UDP-2,4-diacetamido-2,4,6-trideoxy-beta-L-altropyranose hydrolase
MVVPGDAGRRWFAVRVAFRADASVQIGTGHVMRCLTLADELTRQGHECRFVCREHEGHLGDLITSKGYGFTLLPAPSDNEVEANDRNSDNYARWLGVPWQEDARQTLDALTPWQPDWLVVDHYALDAEWERILANVVGSIMVIDDLANRCHECALLLDQNLGRVESDYDGLLLVDCQRLIGPGYALLRPEFANLREQSLKRRQHPELKRILISLGGVDRTNVTGQVLEALSESVLPASTELDIIMGAAAPYLDEVRQQATGLPFKATVSVNVTDMAERMCLADLSIGAAGSTSWERCCLGLPAITVVLAENQRLIGEALSENGAGLLVDVDRIREDLPMMVESMMASENECLLLARQAAMVCDGAGVERVVSVLSGVCS